MLRNLWLYAVVSTVIISSLCLAQGAGSTTHSTQASYAVASEDVYKSVLDQVFPVIYKRSPSISYVIVIRCSPSNGAESQIVIVVKDHGPIDILEYAPASGNVYSQLNKMAAEGQRESAVEMASKIQVKTASTSVAREKGADWYKSFLSASRKMLKRYENEANLATATDSHEVMLDGDAYDVKFILGDRELSWHYTDAEMSRDGFSSNNPMTCWIDSVRNIVADALPLTKTSTTAK